MNQGIGMELEFSVESRRGFNGKVSGKGEVGLVVEGKVCNIERTIVHFKKNYALEAFKSLYIPWKSLSSLSLHLRVD